MGYEFTYKLKPENREALKSAAKSMYSDSACDEAVNDLCTDLAFKIMRPDRGDMPSMRFYIKLMMEGIYRCLLGMYLADVSEKSDDDSFFCGWNLADLTAESDQIKPSDIWKGNSIVTDLLKMAILVPTPDYFTDPDNFNSKFEEVMVLINDFRDYTETKAIEYVVVELKKMDAEEVCDENDDTNL